MIALLMFVAGMILGASIGMTSSDRYWVPRIEAWSKHVFYRDPDTAQEMSEAIASHRKEGL